MRIGLIEMRFWPRAQAWAVGVWQWPHQDVVKRDHPAIAEARWGVGWALRAVWPRPRGRSHPKPP